MKNKLYRAGLIPYIMENEKVKFLFMKPADFRYGGDKFQIAKGKLEIGESMEEAALREASEELGLIQDNITQLTFLGNFLGRTGVYIASIKDKNRFNEPHFETLETEWLTLSEFQIIGRSLHVPIVQDASRAVYLTTK